MGQGSGTVPIRVAGGQEVAAFTPKLMEAADEDTIRFAARAVKEVFAPITRVPPKYEKRLDQVHHTQRDLILAAVKKDGKEVARIAGELLTAYDRELREKRNRSRWESWDFRQLHTPVTRMAYEVSSDPDAFVKKVQDAWREWERGRRPARGGNEDLAMRLGDLQPLRLTEKKAA